MRNWKSDGAWRDSVESGCDSSGGSAKVWDANRVETLPESERRIERRLCRSLRGGSVGIWIER